MVATRRTANVTSQAAAVLAIGQGGNTALKRLLGVKPRRRKPAAKRRAKVGRCKCAAPQEREIQRLLAIVEALKAGRATTATRALRRSQAPDFRTANLFDRQPALYGGEPFKPAEMIWYQAQRSNADNRKVAQNRRRRSRQSAMGFTPAPLPRVKRPAVGRPAWKP